MEISAKNHAGNIPRWLMALWAALAIFSLVWARQSLTAIFPASSREANGRVELSTKITIERLQSQIGLQPTNSALQAQLGLAWLQLVRETGDFKQYSQAERAFEEALLLEADQIDGLIGMGQIALVRHDFAAAEYFGEKARAANPRRAEPLGILVDAYVEQGQYQKAMIAVEEMSRLQPNLASLSRVAYLRELHGDMPGAIEAMQAAVRAGTPGHENTLWARAELGHMHFESGEYDLAEAAFKRALAEKEGYIDALVGLGYLEAARGNYRGALEIFQDLAGRRSGADIARVLAELYFLVGDTNRAHRQLEMARGFYQEYAESGMDVRLELAAFEVDHGADKAMAVELARAAYQRSPTVHAADTLAWSLYQDGHPEEAWRYSQEALRLGTRDPIFFYHAGLIAISLGDEDAGQTYLAEALAINPHFSILYAPHAREVLERIR